MTQVKFPKEGTPLYNIVKARVKRGDPYIDIAESLNMTWKSFKDALRNHGITREITPKELPAKHNFDKSKTWEEHISILEDMDKLLAYHQKVPPEITIEIDTKLPVGLVYSADWHLGMFGVDYYSFKKDIPTIANEPGLYVEIGGDGFQNIIQPSKIGSSHNQAPISVQRGLYAQVLQILIDSVTAVRTGNHNYFSALATGEDWDRQLCRRLRLVYMKHFAKVYYKIGNMIYPSLSLHKGRFQSSFNLTHTCKQYQRLHFPDARIVVVEHQHIADMEQYRYNEKECVAIRTGTYGVYDDYAQQNGFYGAHVANPTIILWPDKDHIVGFKDMYDAIDHLRAVRGGK